MYGAFVSRALIIKKKTLTKLEKVQSEVPPPLSFRVFQYPEFLQIIASAHVDSIATNGAISNSSNLMYLETQQQRAALA